MSPKIGKCKTYGNDIITKCLMNINFNSVDIIKNKNPIIHIEESTAIKYLTRLLMEKDKNYRNEQNLPRINEDNPDLYSKILIETNPIVTESKSDTITNGYYCEKCHNYTGFKTLKQFKQGDEGSALVIQCSRTSCGYIYHLSN